MSSKGSSKSRNNPRPKPFKCANCPEMFPTISGMKGHSKIHFLNKRGRIGYCSKCANYFKEAAGHDCLKKDGIEPETV